MTETPKRLYIHAGLHKTGTSYLQQHVFPRMEGGSFVVTTRKKAHRLMNEFSKAIPPVLWSQESLSGVRDSGEYQESQRRLIKLLSTTFSEAGFLLFLREPAQAIRSFYVQFIHEGGSKPFDDWYRDYEGAFDYRSLVDSVLAGWEDVLLFDHAQLRQDPAFVIGAMERFIGCRFPGWDTTRGHKTNTSVAGSGARLLRRANGVMVTNKSPDGSRILTRLSHGLGFSPRYTIQQGSLQWLNRHGRPLIDDETLQRLKEEHARSWNETLRRIHRKQQEAGLEATAKSPSIVAGNGTAAVL